MEVKRLDDHPFFRHVQCARDNVTGHHHRQQFRSSAPPRVYGKQEGFSHGLCSSAFTQ